MRSGRLTHIIILLFGLLFIGALVVVGASFISSVTAETPIPVPTMEVIVSSTPEKRATIALPPQWTATPNPLATETPTVWSETESAGLNSSEVLAKKQVTNNY